MLKCSKMFKFEEKPLSNAKFFLKINRFDYFSIVKCINQPCSQTYLFNSTIQRNKLKILNWLLPLL